MPETRYRGRRAVAIENEHLRVTVLREGGHVAELLDKATGVNPLWISRLDTRERDLLRSCQPIIEVDCQRSDVTGSLELSPDAFWGPSRLGRQ